MKTIGNIIWFVFTGFFSAIAWAIVGLILCVTIIGIPFGKQCFKIGKFVLFPFGKTIKINFDSHPIGNILWILFCGLGFAISYFVAGILYCITIIGIPFGKQCFKLMKLGFAPMGAEIENS